MNDRSRSRTDNLLSAMSLSPSTGYLGPQARSASRACGPGQSVQWSPVGAGGHHPGVVEEMRPGVAAIAGNAGVEVRAERQVPAEERRESREHGQVAGRVGAQQADERLRDDPPADRPEIQAVGDDLGLSQDVVPERSAGRER